jgi:hypothetical protein
VLCDKASLGWVRVLYEALGKALKKYENGLGRTLVYFEGGGGLGVPVVS